MDDRRKDEPEHFVLVNVAPLVRRCLFVMAINHSSMLTPRKVRGHMLFVPELKLVKPQKLTKKFMLYALSISQAIQREDFALGTYRLLSLAQGGSIHGRHADRVQQCWSLVICESFSSTRLLLPEF